MLGIVYEASYLEEAYSDNPLSYLFNLIILESAPIIYCCQD